MIKHVTVTKDMALAAMKKFEEEYGVTTRQFLDMRYPQDLEKLEEIGSFDAIKWCFYLSVIEVEQEEERAQNN